MKRAALLLPVFALSAAVAFAGDPAPDQKPSPTPAKSKVSAKKIALKKIAAKKSIAQVKSPQAAEKPASAAPQALAKRTAAEAKSEKTSPELDRLFDSGQIAPLDSGSHHPDLNFHGGAEMTIFVSGR